MFSLLSCALLFVLSYAFSFAEKRACSESHIDGCIYHFSVFLSRPRKEGRTLEQTEGGPSQAHTDQIQEDDNTTKIIIALELFGVTNFPTKFTKIQNFELL